MKLKGNIRHSVSAWCYGTLFKGGPQAPAPMTFEAFCVACAGLGLESVELLGPPDWPAVRKAGLICALCRGPSSIDYGWNRSEHHDDLLGYFGPALAEAARNGVPNMVTFSGLRGGMATTRGWRIACKV
jgi:hydroxypyruvate isomerase